MRQIVLRFEDSLYERLERRARSHGRTLEETIGKFLLDQFPGDYLAHHWDLWKTLDPPAAPPFHDGK